MKKIFKPVGVFQESLMQVLVYENQYELMYSFGRFQEFYENPELAGKLFSRSELQEWQPDYYIKWNGCNLPWSIAEKFLDIYKDSLDSHEQAIVKSIVPGKYIVGVHLDHGSDMIDTLRHERAHAYYALNENYRDACFYLACSENEKANTTNAYEILRSMGYGEFVLLDEYQAYCVSGSERLNICKDSGFYQYVTSIMQTVEDQR